MNDKTSDHESFRTFQLMNELENGSTVSQRELAGRLGIAVGLVNSCLKNFVAKGYVRVRTYPRNRYAYLLTPKGFAEKSRLAYQHLNYFTSLYTTTRKDYLELFGKLKANGVESVSFCGSDEVAEIAYMSLAELNMELDQILDDNNVGKRFFNHFVAEISVGLLASEGPIVVTSLKRGAVLRVKLLENGVSPNSIHMLDVMAKA